MSNNADSPGRTLNHYHNQAPDFQQKHKQEQSEVSTTRSTNNKENSASVFLHHVSNSSIVGGSPVGGGYENIKSPTATVPTSTTTGTTTPIATPVKASTNFGYSTSPVFSTPPKTPASFISTTTPLHKTPNHKTPTHKTPTGSSKVLRKHFQRLALTSAHKPHHLHHPIRHHQYHHTPNAKITSTDSNTLGRRLLASGPVRRIPHRHHRGDVPHSTNDKKRVGFDGTFHTPSKNLLRSTASSRGQRQIVNDTSNQYNSNSHASCGITKFVAPANTTTTTSTSSPEKIMVSQVGLVETREKAITESSTVDDDNVTVASMDDITIDSSYDFSSIHQGQQHSQGEEQQQRNEHKYHAQNHHTHSQLQSAPAIRKGCADPVAMILLNDGKENLHYLLNEKDVDTDVDADSSFSSFGSHRYIPSPAKVSSQILSTNLARPIARVASIKAREAIDTSTEQIKKAMVMKLNNNYSNREGSESNIAGEQQTLHHHP